MQYGQISHPIFSYVSQLFLQINHRLENLRKFLYEFECLTTKCSIWLKKNSIKQIYSQLKHSKKQFESLENFVQRHSHLIQYQNNVTKKFWKDFSDFQSNYQQQCIQMDTIEYEHMKLFLDSIQLFSSRNDEKIIPNINIQQIINKWKENNKFRITWLPNEHQPIENNEKIIEQSSSDIDIKAMEDCANDNQDKYVHESNLSWSFTIAKTKEDLSVRKSIVIRNTRKQISSILSGYRYLLPSQPSKHLLSFVYLAEYDTDCTHIIISKCLYGLKSPLFLSTTISPKNRINDNVDLL
jgi:hypothetical protein